MATRRRYVTKCGAPKNADKTGETASMRRVIATVVVGIFRFDQMPNLYSIIGLSFIIIGVLMVNLLGNN